MAEQIKKRCEIGAQWKWDLTHIFPSDQAWEEARAAALETIKAFAARHGHVAEDPKGTIRAFFALYERFAEIYEYAFLRQETDNSDTVAQGLKSKAMSLAVQLESQSAFLQPELLTLPAAELEALQTAPDMADYSEYIRNLIREKPHILSPEQEKLLAMMGELQQAPDNIFSMLSNVDMTFPDVHMPDGTTSPLRESNLSAYLHDRNQDVRRQGWEGIMSTYGRFGATIAAIYGASVKKDQFNADARHMPSAVEASLFPYEIPLSVYDNLIAAVHESLPSLTDYLKLRRERMGLSELHMYDMYAPLVDNFDMDLPYPEAYQLVLEGLAPLGEDYVAKLKEAYSGGWIDVYPNENKSSGAFSCGDLVRVHPYVLLNHNNNLTSAMTIAHELGHAMHSYFSNTHQPYPKADYSLFVAEVASTCNEALMLRSLQKKFTDPKAQAYLLVDLLEKFRTTVYRQTMFAEFERISHDMAAKGEPLTKDALNAAYYDLNQKYYGGGAVVDRLVENEWMRIPHFYRAFYVFVYATGFCAAMALSQRIMQEGESAVQDYRRFLSAGSSVPPLEALKLAGVDMTSPEPVRNALKIFQETIDQFRALNA
ncbi:MAG TPA: oligoendopeptidase F [Candidatus Egerieenecus merdigallinarum]|nr:oligoendopeptidase F [Candidatus Egerieenecus merdigallinarum]